MKKVIMLSLGLTFCLIIYGQSEYSRGFQNGYKVGYCYDDFGCIPPIPPLSPIPKIGESSDNYQQGYNRGFKMGLEDKNIKSSKSSVSDYQQSNVSAPYLGSSSHDPIEFARRRSSARQTSENLKEEIFKIGLEKFDLDIEPWDDILGYNELSEQLKKIRNGYIEFTNKGLNLVTPKTEPETVLYKGLIEAMSNLKVKYNLWLQQKALYSVAQNILKEQLDLPDSLRLINVNVTRQNLNIFLENGINNRASQINELIIIKSK